MVVTGVLVKLATLEVGEMAHVKVHTYVCILCISVIILCALPMQILMSVSVIPTHVIEMLCVQTLMAVLIVPVSLVSLVMDIHAVS